MRKAFLAEQHSHRLNMRKNIANKTVATDSQIKNREQKKHRLIKLKFNLHTFKFNKTVLSIAKGMWLEQPHNLCPFNQKKSVNLWLTNTLKLIHRDSGICRNVAN